MKYLCVKDLKRENGEITAIEGKVYEIESDPYSWRFTDEQGCKDHYLNYVGLCRHFHLIKDENNLLHSESADSGVTKLPKFEDCLSGISCRQHTEIADQIIFISGLRAMYNSIKEKINY